MLATPTDDALFTRHALDLLIENGGPRRIEDCRRAASSSRIDTHLPSAGRLCERVRAFLRGISAILFALGGWRSRRWASPCGAHIASSPTPRTRGLPAHFIGCLSPAALRA